MAETQDSWLSKLGVDIDKYRQKNKEQSAANEKTVDNAVGGAINYMADGTTKLVDSAPVPDALKDAAKTGIRLEKGIYEGVYQGAKGLVGAVQSAGELASGVTLAKGVAEVAEATVSDEARKDLIKDVTDDVNKVNTIGKTAVNPVGSLIDIGSKVVTGYQQAPDKVEFVGKGLGLAGVVAATAAVGGVGESAELATAGEDAAAEGLGEGLIEKPPVETPEAPTPAEPVPQNARPDPRADPEPPPDTIEEPPLGPPASEPPPDTVRDPPAFPQPPRQLEPAPDTEQPETLDPGEVPTLRDPPIPNPKQPFPDPDIRLKPFEPPPLRKIPADPEPLPDGPPDTEKTPELAPETQRSPSSSGDASNPDEGPAEAKAENSETDPATQPRPAPGEEIPPGPATEPGPAPQPIEADPATQPRPAPGEDIPSGPATERSLGAPADSTPAAPAAVAEPEPAGAAAEDASKSDP
jgi:hypothetical protein